MSKTAAVDKPKVQKPGADLLGMELQALIGQTVNVRWGIGKPKPFEQTTTGAIMAVVPDSPKSGPYITMAEERSKASVSVTIPLSFIMEYTQ